MDRSEGANERHAALTVLDEARFRNHLRDVITTAVGDSLKAILLFGSRARADANQESDWDIAILVDEEADVAVLRHRVLRATIGFDPGLGEQLIQPLILRPQDLLLNQSLALNLDTEAVAL